MNAAASPHEGDMPDREAFEAWFSKIGGNVVRDADGGYVLWACRTAWSAWQARAALSHSRAPVVAEKNDCWKISVVGSAMARAAGKNLPNDNAWMLAAYNAVAADLVNSRTLAADQPGDLMLGDEWIDEQWTNSCMQICLPAVTHYTAAVVRYVQSAAAPSRAEPIGCTTQAAVRAMTDEGTKEIMAMLNKKLCETGKAWGWIDVIRAVEDFHGIAPPVGEQP